MVESLQNQYLINLQDHGLNDRIPSSLHNQMSFHGNSKKVSLCRTGTSVIATNQTWKGHERRDLAPSLTHGSSLCHILTQARRCCCLQQGTTLPKAFGERSVIILVGLVLLSFSRLRRRLFSFDYMNSHILLKMVEFLSNGRTSLLLSSISIDTPLALRYIPCIEHFFEMERQSLA